MWLGWSNTHTHAQTRTITQVHTCTHTSAHTYTQAKGFSWRLNLLTWSLRVRADYWHPLSSKTNNSRGDWLQLGVAEGSHKENGSCEARRSSVWNTDLEDCCRPTVRNAFACFLFAFWKVWPIFLTIKLVLLNWGVQVCCTGRNVKGKRETFLQSVEMGIAFATMIRIGKRKNSPEVCI